MKLKKITPLSDAVMDEIGFTWHTDKSDGFRCVSDKLVVLGEEEASSYYEAYGIGFRRGKGILDDESKFVGHIIKNRSRLCTVFQFFKRFLLVLLTH